MRLEDLVVEVREVLPAAPAEAFALLTDVERMAGLGPEHEHAAWQGDARGVGAVFVGRNRMGERTWEVPCTVTAHEPPARFAWDVGDPATPSAHWSYDLSPHADGTLVVQRFAHGPGFTFLRRAVDKHPERAAETVAGRAAQLEQNMRAVLQAAARVLSGGASAG